MASNREVWNDAIKSALHFNSFMIVKTKISNTLSLDFYILLTWAAHIY